MIGCKRNFEDKWRVFTISDYYENNIFFLATQEVEGNNTINNFISTQTHCKCSQKLVYNVCQPERKFDLFGKFLYSH